MNRSHLAAFAAAGSPFRQVLAVVIMALCLAAAFMVFRMLLEIGVAPTARIPFRTLLVISLSFSGAFTVLGIASHSSGRGERYLREPYAFVFHVSALFVWWASMRAADCWSEVGAAYIAHVFVFAACCAVGTVALLRLCNKKRTTT